MLLASYNPYFGFMPKNNSTRKILGAIVLILGFAAFGIGALTELYSTTVGFIVMLCIWFIIGPIVARATGGKGRWKEFKETTKKEHWKDY